MASKANSSPKAANLISMPENPSDFRLPRSPRELVMLATPKLRLRAEGSRASSGSADENVHGLNALLSATNASIRPLFGLTEERLLARAPQSPGAPIHTDISLYYRIEAPDAELEALAQKLRELPGVAGAYIKPEGEPPAVTPIGVRNLNDMLPLAIAVPVTTSFANRQGYLRAAPEGIDAHYASTLIGGSGAGVRVIDCEWGWNFAHEDLLQNQSGVLVGTNSPDDNHGTAVLGVISADSNPFGVQGIAPDTQVGAASFENRPTAQTIREASDKLSQGDIILLEIHRPGPRSNGQGQFGYIPIEWWPDDFAAIQYASNRGIIVVEAGGNGHQDLDDPIYDVPQIGFPTSWSNPFNPQNPSSGAIMVGAGNPPAGTHGRMQHPSWGEIYIDRARCSFSNFGKRIDCQGWGWEVTTTGYGDLQGGDRSLWYSDQFAGTSSASPIVVGVLCCLQGIARAQGGSLLTAQHATHLLRVSGSLQQDAPNRPATQRIGNRPDLRQMVEKMRSEKFLS